MPDISMCHGRDCHERERCYRYRARPSLVRQAYGSFDERRGNIACAYFLVIMDGDRVTDQRLPSPKVSG